jgi:large-conductance mechanosensitive channel
VAHVTTTDQIAVATLHPLFPLLMTDETPDVEKVRIRRQPRVPVTLAVFLAAVVGFMLVVTGLFALMRYLGKH